MGSLAGPISAQAALVFVSSLVSLAFAGHLGGLALSQAVLASSCYNITGAAVLLGLASGMETLCGQVRAWFWHVLCASHDLGARYCAAALPPTCNVAVSSSGVCARKPVSQEDLVDLWQMASCTHWET